MQDRRAQIPGRLHSLDTLRGAAALCVVFWHWQHFFYSGTKRGTPALNELPLADVFFFLYSKGWLAVDLFFALSGFVFYWLYSQGVAAGTVRPGNFVVLRLSRLYPLHFLTLIAVLAGQLAYRALTGTYYVFPFNDAYHFVLNLLFVSSWTFERGYSFNAPIWSVSVEVLLYALFFGLCRVTPVRAGLLVLLSIAGFVLVSPLYLPIGRGIGSFFLGGCIFFAYARVVREDRVQDFCKWIPWLTVALWLAWIAAVRLEWGGMTGSQDALRLLARLQPGLDLFQDALNRFPVVVLFPLTILSLVLLETRRETFGRRLAFLGDISYSSYLLHFPLQLLVMGLVASLSLDRALFYSAWTLAAFFLVLVIASFVTFHCFERPLQRWLRKRLLKSPAFKESSRPQSA
jgi:peptidoglycan/LPS O-acetylase OafA/YrhL